MKKKYYSILISFAVLLIVSMVTIGVLASKLLKSNSQDNYYSIGETKISSISYVTGQNTELVGFSYSTNNSVHIKSYNYKAENVPSLIAEYDEYLVTEKNFVDDSNLVTEGDTTNYSMSYTNSENNDTLVISISYTASTIQIQLTYTYVD